MKIRIFTIILFTVFLFFTIISTLALFGQDDSISILHWVRNRIVYLILAILFGYGVYFLSPFVLNNEEDDY